MTSRILPSSTTLLFALLLCAGPAAAVPQTVPLSGTLTDDNGAVENGTVTLQLKVYDALTGGNVVFEESQNVQVQNGNFTVYLGMSSTLDLTVFADNDELYLGITVDDDEEMSPRFPLATVPYAAHAASADDALTLDGNAAEDFAAAAHTHAFADLTNIPSGLADGDDDTVYSGASPIVVNGTVIGLTDACTPGQVLKSTGSSWVCASDESAVFTASAPVIVNGSNIALAACGEGEVLKFTSGNWTCSADATGGTSISAGTGLVDTAGTFSVDASMYQRRVNACGPGDAIRSIAEDGSVTCVTAGGTSVIAGTGLTDTMGTFSVDDSVVQNRVTGDCAAGYAVRSINEDGSVVCEQMPTPTGGGGDGYAVSTNLLFEDTSGTWTALTFPTTDDDSVDITLPFAIDIFGVSSGTSAVLGTNGWLMFDTNTTETTSSYISNSSLPDASKGHPFLAAFWDDLNNVTARTQTLGSSPNRVFYIDVDAETYICPNDPCFFGYTIALHENSNRIDVRYQDVDADINPRGSGATIGLQSANGAEARAVSHNTMVLKAGNNDQFVSFMP